MIKDAEASKYDKAVRRTFGGTAVFYILIAFEFLYMASPFAVYFYSVYSPALNFFNNSPTLGWVITYFMPHIVLETSSPLINIHNIVGGILALLGFGGFVIGACQVYYHKLARKGVVTGGIYNFIRHPQYTSFIICSFGLLILWPRYIVLFMFTTMLFAYYLLARVEERECEEKFGQTYMEYRQKTGMFLPFRIFKNKKGFGLPKSKPAKLAALLSIYIVTIVLAIGIARVVNNYTLNSLYSIYTKDAATISVCKLEESKIDNILKIGLSDPEVKNKLDIAKEGNSYKFLNYVLPCDWYVAEIPMNGIGIHGYHNSNKNYNRNQFKVIFTKAQMRIDNNVTGKQIIRNLKSRKAVVEVWVDVAEKKIIKVLDAPDSMMYKDIPVAIF